MKFHAVELVEEVMVTLEDKNLKVCTSCLVCEYYIAGIFRGYGINVCGFYGLSLYREHLYLIE